MTRTKLDHIQAVSEACLLSKSHSAQVVNSLIEIIKSTLERGEEVSIRRFGKFRVCSRNGLRSRTGKEYDLPAGVRRIVTFRSSPTLDERLNVEDLP